MLVWGAAVANLLLPKAPLTDATSMAALIDATCTTTGAVGSTLTRAIHSPTAASESASASATGGTGMKTDACAIASVSVAMTGIEAIGAVMSGAGRMATTTIATVVERVRVHCE